MKAIKSSPLSVTVPMITFTPAFLLLTSPIILGEFPTVYGIIGVLLVVLGSYTLHIKDVKKGLISPFRALVKEKGPLIMLLVAFLWSISSNFDKMAVLHSNPIFFVIVSNTILAAALFFVLLKKSGTGNTSGNIRYLLPIGLFSALALIFQMTAISMALVVYVIAIKRMSTMFTTLGGHFFFKEVRIRERLVGVFIMIIGVLLIALF